MGADNTDVLRDDATGEIKPLQVYLMADRWTANADEQAACLVRMRELGITPLLPQGGDYQVADSCHPWPPSEEEEKRAKVWGGKGYPRTGPGGQISCCIVFEPCDDPTNVQ